MTRDVCWNSASAVARPSSLARCLASFVMRRPYALVLATSCLAWGLVVGCNTVPASTDQADENENIAAPDVEDEQEDNGNSNEASFESLPAEPDVVWYAENDVLTGRLLDVAVDMAFGLDEEGTLVVADVQRVTGKSSDDVEILASIQPGEKTLCARWNTSDAENNEVVEQVSVRIDEFALAPKADGGVRCTFDISVEVERGDHLLIGRAAGTLHGVYATQAGEIEWVSAEGSCHFHSPTGYMDAESNTQCFSSLSNEELGSWITETDAEDDAGEGGGGDDNSNLDVGDDKADGDIDIAEVEKDTDGDGVSDSEDNCPSVANPTQADGDKDGKGDACDEEELLCDASCDTCHVGTPEEDNCDEAWNGAGDGCDCGCQFEDSDCDDSDPVVIEAEDLNAWRSQADLILMAITDIPVDLVYHFDDQGVLEVAELKSVFGYYGIEYSVLQSQIPLGVATHCLEGYADVGYGADEPFEVELLINSFTLAESPEGTAVCTFDLTGTVSSEILGTSYTATVLTVGTLTGTYSANRVLIEWEEADGTCSYQSLLFGEEDAYEDTECFDWLEPEDLGAWVLADGQDHAYPEYLDADADMIVDLVDNCPDTYNVDQADADGDGWGDACDTGDLCADYCDYCYIGTDQENDCPEGWNGAGDGCDCGCQFEDSDCEEAEWLCDDYCDYCYVGTELEDDCPKSYMGTMDGCDCGCQWEDPDCTDREWVCDYACDFCHAGTVYENACLEEWNGTLDGCDCGCQFEDPDCEEVEWLCEDYCDYCHIGTVFENDCPADYLGTDDGCDCGCQIEDPDCAAR